MPEVSRFLGIIIKMFFNSKNNLPHFHAIYGEYNGEFDIQTLEMIEGDLSSRVQSLIMEWAETHKEELMAMWSTKKIKKIEGLK